MLWWLIRLLPAGVIRWLGGALFSKSQGRFEAAAADPQGAQVARLREIVERNRDTVFGREHDFQGISDFESFRQRVPIRGYAELEPYVDRMVAGERGVLVADDVVFFARTSGTTGRPKFIPVTASYLDEMRASRRVWSRAVIRAFPGLVQGHVLGMQSPGVDGHTAGGVPFGSITVALSGAADDQVASPLEGIPKSVYAVRDFDAKYYLVLRAALDLRISLLAALNPSTLVLLCQRLNTWVDALAADLDRGTVSPPGEAPAEVLAQMQARARPRPELGRLLRACRDQRGLVRPVDVWPTLCGVLTWQGGAAPFYLARLRPYIGDLPVMDYGYAASEGAFSIPMAPGDGRGVAALTGHVLEFVPEAEHGRADARALTLGQLAVGRRYAVIITASSGLYRYDINDIVEVVGMYRGVPELRFVHKGGNMVSITGEKVGEAHVVEAMNAVLSGSGLEVSGFLVTARLGAPPHYVLAVESPHDLAVDTLRTLGTAFDTALMRVNLEYEAKRQSQRLGCMQVALLAPGCFEALRLQRLREGAPDAHVKVPHLWRDEAILDRLDQRRLLFCGEPK